MVNGVSKHFHSWAGVLFCQYLGLLDLRGRADAIIGTTRPALFYSLRLDSSLMDASLKILGRTTNGPRGRLCIA